MFNAQPKLYWKSCDNEITSYGHIGDKGYSYKIEYCEGNQFTKDFRFIPEGFFRCTCNNVNIAYVSAKDEPRKAMEECEKHYASLIKRSSSPITFRSSATAAFIGPIEFTVKPTDDKDVFCDAYATALKALVEKANEILAPHGIEIEEGDNDDIGCFKISGEDPSLYGSDEWYDSEMEHIEDVFVKLIK